MLRLVPQRKVPGHSTGPELCLGQYVLGAVQIQCCIERVHFHFRRAGKPYKAPSGFQKKLQSIAQPRCQTQKLEGNAPRVGISSHAWRSFPKSPPTNKAYPFAVERGCNGQSGRSYQSAGSMTASDPYLSVMYPQHSVIAKSYPLLTRQPPSASQFLGSPVGSWNPLAFRRKLQYHLEREVCPQEHSCKV
jgi:hypothetical protein